MGVRAVRLYVGFGSRDGRPGGGHLGERGGKQTGAGRFVRSGERKSDSESV